ncbi:SIS domain-containing protein [Candidatus Allofournierella merdavium]|uniref:SIS domain-containing protein n=1 Tax=Candidatus Allofournierella merdavium TaxID=2838593 RepID=UPI00374F6490
MNGFIQEVATQGELLGQAAAYYREGDGKALIQRIKAEYRAKGMHRVILSGMGSSLYAMDSVRSYLTGHGIPCLSFSSFELSRFQFGQLDEHTLLIAVSQSGNSAEVVELVEKARQVTTVVGIYNNEGSLLSQMADIKLPILANKEVSITSKTYEITMLILNVIAHSLTGELDGGFWGEVDEAVDWITGWLADWEANSRPMYDFAQGIELFDLLANDSSLATARQLSLAYREGLHNCTAVWECADYAHGQYHSAKMANRYLAQMFFPVLKENSKELKMFSFILEKGGRVMVFTSSDLPARENVYVVKLPLLRRSLMPLLESVCAETMLGMLFGPAWVKDH